MADWMQNGTYERVLPSRVRGEKDRSGAELRSTASPASCPTCSAFRSRVDLQFQFRNVTVPTTALRLSGRTLC